MAFLRQAILLIIQKITDRMARLLIVLGVLQGKVYFYYLILTISRFYKLPVVSEIMKSIVILK